MARKKKKKSKSNWVPNLIAEIALLLSVVSLSYTVYKVESNEEETLGLVSSKLHILDSTLPNYAPS